MIAANQLRIGNQLKRNGIVVTIDARSIFDIWDKSDEYSPIPLTPEVLERYGFVKVEDLGDMVYYQLPEIELGYGICFNHEDIEFYKYNKSGTYTLMYDDSNCQYLHQLQNLIFSLTGTELTFR